MLSRVNFRGYVPLRRGLLIYREKKYYHVCLSSYTATQKSEIFAQENFTSSSENFDKRRRDVISRNASEMILRDFLNCFYVSGWVPFHLMKECVSKFSSTEPFNGELGSILLKCSGLTLATCKSKARVNITNDVWKEFSRAADLGHDHYHILLNVDAENRFYRSDVIREMEKKGLQPNRITYDLLLQSASESNNIVAFNAIKTCLEKNDMALDENFFSSLVRMHTLNKNMNGIQDIEKIFRESDSKPSAAITYALMRAYASLGPYRLLFDLAEEIITSGQDIKSNQLAKIVVELSRSVSTDIVVKFVDHIHSLGLRMAVKDVNWLSAYLTSRHLEDVAFQMLRKMSWEDLPVLHMDSPPATLVFVMSAFWTNDKKPRSLLEIINTVENSMRIPWTMETALHGALRQQNSESAWIILEEMHKKSKTLRSHYFWPLLLSSSCPKEMFWVIQRMIDFDIELDTTTLKSFVMDRLLPRGVDPTYLENRLIHIGVRAKLVILALDIYFLENDKMNVTLKRVSRPKFEGSTELVEALTSAYLRNQDDKSMILFLNILRSDKLTKTDWIGQVVVDVTSRSPLKGERLLEIMQSEGIRLSPDLIVLIKALREQAKLEPGKGLNDIKEYDESGNWPRLFSGTYLHPKQMNIEELENHLTELRSKGMNTRTILRKLFLMHANKRNVKRARELLDDLLEIPNLEWSAAMLVSKMYLLAMLGKVEDSVETYLEVKSKFPNFAIDAYKIMALAECLVRVNRFKDSLEILSDLPVSKGRSHDLTSFLVLLEAYSQRQNSINEMRNVTNLMIMKQYVSPCNPIMNFYVDYHLQRGDLEGAVKEFQTLNKRYNLTPKKFELLSALHSAKLKGKLNNFNELKEDVLRVLKESQIYHPLDELLPAAQAGDEQEVVSIMSRILENHTWRPFEWQCRHWATTNNVVPLEVILSAAQDLKAKQVDMSSVINAAADEYYYQGERKKLAQILEIISRGEISVSPEIRRSIDKLLRSCGLLGKASLQSLGPIK